MNELNVNTEILKSVIGDLDSLTGYLKAMIQETAEQEPVEKKKSKPKKADKPEVKTCSLEEVRGILAEKSRAGLTAKVRELIAKYGGDKLSDVDPKNYANVAREAGELTND